MDRQEILDDFTYDPEGYNEMYLERTKQGSDPKELVGPGDKFEEMREWQFNLLKEQGMQPGDTLFDLGCGILRGGIPAIDYLDRGNYVGADISIKALKNGYERLHDNQLGHKNPTIIQNEDLKFDRISHLDADYMIAQSVWTHLPPKKIKECVSNMDKILKDDGVLIATAHLCKGNHPTVDKDVKTTWGYPPDHLATLLDEYGYKMKVLESADHPNNQRVLKIVSKD